MIRIGTPRTRLRRGAEGLLATVCLLLVSAAVAPEEAAGQGAERRVYVGVYLHDVSSFDQKNGVFDVDVDVWAKWRGELDRDQLRVSNAAEIERVFLGADDDGDWHSARWRIRGRLRGEFPLDRFPFDEQTLAVTFELPERYGTLAPDLASSGMADRFSLTDWLYEPEFRPSIASQVFASDLGNLSSEGRSTTVNRVSFEVWLERPIVPVVLKLFLPLAIIALVAIAALFVAPVQIEARSAMGVTALLSCFAFQFTVSDSLPAVAYITLADTLFLVAYVLSSVAIVVTIIAYGLDHRQRRRASLWVDRVFRLLIPAAAGAAVWTAVPMPGPQAEVAPDPFPSMTRPASERETVRVGTTLLSRISGSPLSIAGAWGLVHEDPEAGRQAIFVERAPGVDNDALRFLPGGKIEVTWRLREGSRWSDGEPLTTDDLLLPLEASPDDQVDHAEAVDDRTVVIRWRDRLARALETPSAWPAHVLRPIFETPGEDGEPGGYDAVRAHRRNRIVPTLGPYHIVEYTAGERIVAEANPHFPGPAPSVARAELVKMDSSESTVRAFEAGEIDIITPNSVTVEEARALAEGNPDAVRIRPSAFHIFLHPDLDHPLLGQLRIRRAILAAIDRERIARDVYGDAGRVSHVPVPGPPPPGVEPVDFDPEAARTALEEAEATGQTIKLLMRDSPVSAAILDGVERDLRAAGLEVARETIENPLRAWQDGGHGGLLLHTVRGARDSAPQRYWNLRLVDGAYPPNARNEAYTDEVHGLVEREMRALYPERREQLRDALFAQYARRLPNLPLLFAAERMLAAPALHGWEQRPDVPFGRGMERWFFSAPAAATARPAPSPAPPVDGE